MGRFCAKCGKEAEGYVRGLCSSCFWKGADAALPSDIAVTICPTCRSYLQGKRWVKREEIADDDSKIVSAAKTEFLRHTRLPEGVALEGASGEILERNEEGLPQTIVLNVNLKEKETGSQQKTSVLVSVTYESCSNCLKFARKEHEAVVQVRASDRIMDRTDQKNVEEALAEISKKAPNRRGSGIVEVKEKEGGLDMKFTSLATARIFAKKLRDDYGAAIQESPKLVGVDRRTGGRVYKNTISIKMPKLRAGQLVVLKGNIYLFSGFDRGRAIIEDLESKGRKTLGAEDYNELESISEDRVRRVRLDGRTSDHADLYDMDDMRFIEVPSGAVPPDMKVGEEGLLIKMPDKEKVFRVSRFSL